MHNAAYRALDMPWHYVPFKPETLKSALDGMRALGIRGFGISMPYKLEIMPLLDEIDPLATRIGAVNTVVNDNGQLIGHNTDWVGAARAIEEVRPLREARVLLLGAGGAARAVAHGLIEHGATVILCNRSEEKGRELASRVGAQFRPWSARQALDDIDIVLNASSLGMKDVDPSSPIDEAMLRPELTVMDIVYKPLETELLRLAQQRGATTIHGGRMLLHQAARQFELYTDTAAPLDAMDRALRKAIAPPEN